MSTDFHFPGINPAMGDFGTLADTLETLSIAWRNFMAADTTGTNTLHAQATNAMITEVIAEMKLLLPEALPRRTYQKLHPEDDPAPIGD